MKINFQSRTIELTAKYMRQASKPYSREYEELIRIMRDLPDFKVTVKRSYRMTNANYGLTYGYMEHYIAQHAPEKMDEFTMLRAACGYPVVAKWFRAMFQDANAMVGFCTTLDTAA